MSVQVSGSVSKDFPLFHSNLIPLYMNNKKESRKPHENTFFVTNEHPDFFKLDGMKEGGYKNPYLNEVIKTDRNESFKKIDYARRQLNLINFINTNRNYSQDPKITRYIINEYDNKINKKREQKMKDKMAIKNRSLTQENSNNIRNFEIKDKIINELEKYIPKIDYKMTRTIDYEKPIKTEYETIKLKNNSLEKGNKNRYNFNLNSQKSAYLKNLNDYKISEAQQRDLNMGLIYQRQPSFRNDLIRGKYNIIYPPPYRGENWGAFKHDYYTIENNRNKFRKMGGLFSEFIDKNINVISLNKRELREKVERERELRNSLKSKNFQIINNTSNSNNAFH